MKLNSGVKQRIRRERVLKMLELQLIKGTKVVSDKTEKKIDQPEIHSGDIVALSDHDIKRISNEIGILKQRV